MKYIARIAFLLMALFAQTAYADTGPYYITYPGYCNIRQVYLNSFNDIYGTEVGCPTLLGAPVIGVFVVDGKAIVSTIRGTQTCINVYHPGGYLSGGCTTGTGITYPTPGTWNVRADQSSGEQKRQFNVTTAAPDMTHSRNLPALD